MKTSCFADWRAAARDRLARTVFLAMNCQPVGCFFSTVTLAFVLTGCATRPGVVSKSSPPLGIEQAQVSPFGAIAFADESSPATFSFQKAKGKRGSAWQAIWNSAELGLSAPGAGVIASADVLSEMSCEQAGGDPRFLAAVVGVVGGLTTVGTALAGPVVGAQGLILSFKTVSPAELAEREAALTDGLSQMAVQQPFHDALVQTGAARIRTGFFSLKPQNPTEQIHTHGSADVILEARVDDLRLERAGSDESSYCLRIKTHARLLRVADGAVCFYERAEYRSSKALFLDWTDPGAIQAVTETGYRALAGYYIDQLLQPKTNLVSRH